MGADSSGLQDVNIGLRIQKKGEYSEASPKTRGCGVGKVPMNLNVKLM